MRASGDVYELSARVVRRIQADFPRDASEIRRALARTRLPLVPPEHAVLQEQIHASVLRLARGDRRRFDSALRSACAEDWRDVVMQADLQHPEQITAYLDVGDA